MKKSTEPSSGKMSKASTTEAKLSSKADLAEYYEKENEVNILLNLTTCIYVRSYVCVNQQKFTGKHFSVTMSHVHTYIEVKLQLCHFCTIMYLC